MDEDLIVIKIYNYTTRSLRSIMSIISYIILIGFIMYLSIYNYILIFIFSVITIISFYIKNIIKKERPIDKFDIERKNIIDNFSFPSIHTILSIFIFFITINPIILIVPILRVLSLRHYIVDVLYSSFIGISIYLLYYILYYQHFIIFRW
ncbi:hypothetical protein MJ1_0752 [Nanobdella aerobiophila]|uniref:Phosphatidic acid phosphatase type 2/haloperoxidase domain-containing protein n=1 Tax=Nanobdella aerobiophila TaxID=2586965 RepID=A0A915SAN2_9ARCH|nr:hypothetical protein MJ1_0752 [Nanobdella aerobiophila]